MAGLPTVGGDDGVWATKYNEFLQVGHDADGTHTKAQMLTDMGWAPTSAIGSTGQTTLPNGVILKWGSTASLSDGDTAILYPTAFPSATFCVSVIPISTAADNISIVIKDASVSKTGFTFTTINETTGTGVYWFAIGY